MYKVIIIEDEPKPREVLCMKILQEFPILEIVATAVNADEGYQLCTEHKPDIVFLDVNMPVKSGFDFLTMFDKVPFEIIFCTAYHKYALDAFKVSAVGYLLKPVNTEDLRLAVEQAIRQLHLKNTEKKIDALLLNIKQGNSERKKLVIPGIEKYEFVDIEKIILCESTEKYTYIYTEGAQKLLSSYYLGHYKNILEPMGFFVPHKSYIINGKYITSLTHEDEIIMKGIDMRIPLARRRKTDFLSFMALN